MFSAQTKFRIPCHLFIPPVSSKSSRAHLSYPLPPGRVKVMGRPSSKFQLKPPSPLNMQYLCSKSRQDASERNLHIEKLDHRRDNIWD